MPPAQRTAETSLRLQATAAALRERLTEQRAAEQRAAEQRAARVRRATPAHRHDPYDTGPDQSLQRGMGLGR